jgi:glucan 1,3-beta-glucosidase
MQTPRSPDSPHVLFGFSLPDPHMNSITQSRWLAPNLLQATPIYMPSPRVLLALLLASDTLALNDFQEVAEGCAKPDQFCGNSSIGPNCCSSGQYCQPWNPWYYQCVLQPAKCGIPEVGVDFWGNDLAEIADLKLPEECCNRCADTLGCLAFTFAHAGWDGRTRCYLKSGVDLKKNIPGAVSAAVTSPRVAACSTHVGGYCGNKDWSISCPYGSYCHPWSTGYYQCIKAPKYCSMQLTDVDFHGNDLRVVYGLHPSGCCEKCTQTSGCVGYTFVSDNPGQSVCYLKSSINGKRRAVGAVSGKVDLTGVSHIQEKIRRGEARSRAVNLGAWLVSEYWMSWDSYTLWRDVPTDVASQGEQAVMRHLGQEKGTAAFEEHWQTWLTESDIKEIADTGVLNTVRVPVGYWITRDATVSPSDEDDAFALGGLKYLDRLINDWAVKHDLAVIVSLHAHKGSQNGHEDSAPIALGSVEWSTSPANVNSSLEFAAFIAGRYKDSAAFLGLNLMNEPAPPTDRDVVKNYYTEAYNRIRAAGNRCIILVSPLATEQDPSGFDGLLQAPERDPPVLRLGLRGQERAVDPRPPGRLQDGQPAAAAQGESSLHRGVESRRPSRRERHVPGHWLFSRARAQAARNVQRRRYWWLGLLVLEALGRGHSRHAVVASAARWRPQARF